MSTLLTIPDDAIDYSELTKSYMGVFYTEKFTRFLNTTQNGAAHSSSGMQFSILIKSLFTSLCLCSIQLTLFCFFRPIFKTLYQPRCFCVPNNERMELLPPGFLSWVIPTLKYNINYYLSLGLDAYFFVRFIHILLLYFICIGSLNILVLVPLNWTSHSNEFPKVSGMDKLSISNVSPNNVSRLNVHFIMSMVTIGLFQWLILYELDSFVKIRQSHMFSKHYRSKVISNTVLIKNVPPSLRDIDVLSDILNPVVPGGIKNVWFLYNFDGISDDVEELHEIIDLLERGEMSQQKKVLQTCMRKPHKLELPDIPDSLFYPPIFVKPFTIPVINRRIRIKLPGNVRFLFLQSKIPRRGWCMERFKTRFLSVENWKRTLSEGKLEKGDKVFIQFRTQTGASIAHQCLMSEIQGSLDKAYLSVNPEDIIWDNIRIENSVSWLLERYIISSILIALIVLYVIPVSVIGMFSHLPSLIRLMPFLGWVYTLPENVRDTISSLLPSILLSVLTDLVLLLFRHLIYFKGKVTRGELELELQVWYFAFLFVQQFLVVTISSSVTVVFKQLIDQPTSIPILLATNLPKAATFFFQYIAIKGFTFCGNSFLRVDQLVLSHTLHKIQDRTPRQVFKRLTKLLKARWGSIYPVYSVYASIGLAYCIISPLISLFIIFILSLSLLYYKYALRYIYNHINESETNGRMYPIALLHIYSGIYCLESCLIGVFFLSRNEDGKCPLKIQGWIMSFVLFGTIFYHITLYNRYVKHFDFLPILEDKVFQDGTRVQEAKTRVTNEKLKRNLIHNGSNSEEHLYDEYYSNLKLLYLHPSFKYEPSKLWLPADKFSISETQIHHIENEGKGLITGSTDGATVSMTKFGLACKVSISKAPPDFK